MDDQKNDNHLFLIKKSLLALNSALAGLVLMSAKLSTPSVLAATAISVISGDINCISSQSQGR